MDGFLDAFNNVLGIINSYLWHDVTLFIILGVGVLFTFWTKFAPILSLTHGVQVLFGKFDKKDDPGAINHFQALSAALSATVGLGNIGGVAIAVSLGGPGAVFWMWIVGLVGMSLKTTEVSMSMLFRNTDDPDSPHGGPMWVAKLGLKSLNPSLAPLGKALGVIFCITLLISSFTGGNMFQSWNVAEITFDYFQLPKYITGLILAVLTGAVILGGIKRIGKVAGTLVPFMCGTYLIAGLYVIILNITEVPSLFGLIFSSAFNPTEASGAFLGGTVGYAFLWGMKRALFSNEAGQGSAPIAHAAAKTNEPVREGILAGMGPFIDTIVVCTITALVILSTGAWNRGVEGDFVTTPEFQESSQGEWTLPATELGENKYGEWREGQQILVVINGDSRAETKDSKHVLLGRVRFDNGTPMAKEWDSYTGIINPTFNEQGVFGEYRGASLTAHAFDRAHPGLGMIMVTLASWLFAISTMISWSYYGEQGIHYLFGEKGILPYKVIYCVAIFVATLPIVRTTEELGNLTDLGTGVMLMANIPIMIIMGKYTMDKYHDYRKRLKAGEFHPNS